MGSVITIKYDSEKKSTDIWNDSDHFDSSRLSGRSIEEWAYPYKISGVRWNGVYEELKSFLGGETDFTIIFDGSEGELAILKNALSNTAVRVLSLNSKVVILYNHDQHITKVAVNGKQVSFPAIQNKPISEWVDPFHSEDTDWKGIFAELESIVGIGTYSIQFGGKIDDIKELIAKCPDTVSITYRSGAQKQGAPKRAASSGNSSGASAALGNTAAAAGKLAGNIKNAVNSQAINNISEKLRQDISDDEVDSNLQNIPIKNEFVRKNIVAICAALSIAMLFLPFMKIISKVTANVEGAGDFAGDFATKSSFKFSGFSTLFGANDCDGTFFAIMLLIGPIALICMNYIEQIKPYRRAMSLGIPALCAVFEILSAVRIKALVKTAVKAGQQGASVKISLDSSFQIGFFLLLLTYILTAVVGYIAYYGLPVKKAGQ